MRHAGGVAVARRANAIMAENMKVDEAYILKKGARLLKGGFEEEELADVEGRYCFKRKWCLNE